LNLLGKSSGVFDQLLCRGFELGDGERSGLACTVKIGELDEGLVASAALFDVSVNLFEG
jgi:hypothetical protein